MLENHGKITHTLKLACWVHWDPSFSSVLTLLVSLLLACQGEEFGAENAHVDDTENPLQHGGVDDDGPSGEQLLDGHDALHQGAC